MENSTWNWTTTGCNVVNCSTNSSAVAVNSQEHATKYAVVALYLMTTVFGTCGNSVTIFIMLRHRRIRTVAACFILNLAVADDLFLLCLPFMAYSTFTGQWVFGDVVCRLMNTFWGVNQYASIFTMTLMSVDRYLAVVHPLKSLPYRTCSKALVVCAVIWTVGFLFVLPLPLYSRIHRGNCEVVNCCLLGRPTKTSCAINFVILITTCTD